jgi:hypothetical protein
VVDFLRRFAGLSGRTLWFLAAWADATFLAGLFGPWMAGAGLADALNKHRPTYRWSANNPSSSGALS